MNRAGASPEPNGTVPVQPAPMPGIQRRAGGRDDLPFNGVVAVAFGNLRAGGLAERA